jgi:acyl-coenzyme A synthetase/AMP-(fatty) acid ligase
LDVENLVSPLAGVKLVRVYGQANPIAGQIVALDVVCNEGSNPAELEEDIRRACDVLPPAGRPRSINFVDAILTNNFKMSRR